MLGAILWITIVGANVPSAMLAKLLVDDGHALLSGWMVSAGSPDWLRGLLVDGMYLATAWVIAVMLPPMAIFFPCFTLLEAVSDMQSALHAWKSAPRRTRSPSFRAAALLFLTLR